VRVVAVLCVSLAGCAGNPSGDGAHDASASGGTGGAIVLGDAGPGPVCDGSFDDAPIEAGSDAASAECAGLDGAVTYSGDIAPILASCKGELCHDAPTYTSLVEVKSKECCGSRVLITPNHPESSYILNKLRGTDMCTGERMPRGKTPLSDAQIALFVEYICEGAPND
jgi:hypothetical protein